MLHRRFSVLLGRYCFYYRCVGFSPLPEKAETGGEDAYLSTSNVQAVLDGVSWWRDNTQVDAGLYSASVARHMYNYIEEDLLGEAPVSSYRLLERGYEDGKHEEIQGTCTALVATLQEIQPDIQTRDGYLTVVLDDQPDPVVHPKGIENPLLDIATIGDCTLFVIRRGKVVYVTQEQQHDLDYPYQIGTGSKDTPRDGQRLLMPINRGDVIVMGTDGIFDNLYVDRIAEMLWPPIEKLYANYDYLSENYAETLLCFQPERNRNRRTALIDDLMAVLDESVARVLKEAQSVSVDIRGDTPYATKCVEGGALYEGGKPDDMTLLVSVIGEADDDTSGERFSSGETPYPIPYRDWP